MGYAHPETLVDTTWVLAHHADDNVKMVEVDVDMSGYDEGHIPGAIGWNWSTDLSDQWTLAPEHLLQRHPISPYIGTTFRGRVRRTIRGGDSIYTDGRITAQSNGRFVRPERN